MAGGEWPVASSTWTVAGGRPVGTTPTSVKHYRDLIAWQKAIDFAEAVHRTTRGFPRDEIFGLTSQVRRAVVSIPSNIAEGQGRGSTNEFVHFLNIATGSLQEAETQLILAHRFEYLAQAKLDRLLEMADEIGRVNNGLIRSLAPKRR